MNMTQAFNDTLETYKNGNQKIAVEYLQELNTRQFAHFVVWGLEVDKKATIDLMNTTISILWNLED